VNRVSRYEGGVGGAMSVTCVAAGKKDIVCPLAAPMEGGPTPSFISLPAPCPVVPARASSVQWGDDAVPDLAFGVTSFTCHGSM
jgi:hypothetical protein